MVDNAPVTFKKKWKSTRKHIFDTVYYMDNNQNEAIYGICSDNYYKHNYFKLREDVEYRGIVNKLLEGIEIRWNYNIFENE